MRSVIVDRVADQRVPFYRPALPDQESEGVQPELINLMKHCHPLSLNLSHSLNLSLSLNLNPEPACHHLSLAESPLSISLMKQCWTEDPSDRPTFDNINKSLKIINKGKSVAAKKN